MDEQYWDQVAPIYLSQVHDSLACDRNQTIARRLDQFASRHAVAASAVDFGCGVGRCLRALSDRFRVVYALDHSRRCLDEAQIAHASLTNVIYRKADLTSTRPLKDWKKPRFGICTNVLIAPDLELRTAIVKSMHRNLAPSAHLLVIVPAMESVLYTDVRLVEWNMRDGMSHHRAIHNGLKHEPGVLGPAAAGVVDRGGVPTKHYLCEEAVLMMRAGGFDVEEVDKVEFDWSEEFTDPPRWMRDPYPWHWLLVCRR